MTKKSLEGWREGKQWSWKVGGRESRQGWRKKKASKREYRKELGGGWRVARKRSWREGRKERKEKRRKGKIERVEGKGGGNVLNGLEG